MFRNIGARTVGRMPAHLEVLRRSAVQNIAKPKQKMGFFCIMGARLRTNWNSCVYHSNMLSRGLKRALNRVSLGQAMACRSVSENNCSPGCQIHRLYGAYRDATSHNFTNFWTIFRTNWKFSKIWFTNTFCTLNFYYNLYYQSTSYTNRVPHYRISNINPIRVTNRDRRTNSLTLTIGQSNHRFDNK